MVNIIIILYTIFFCLSLSADEYSGKWWMNVENKGWSVLELEERFGKLHGRIVDLEKGSGTDVDVDLLRCEKCVGKNKNAKIIGLTIISDLVWDERSKQWKSGKLINPYTGKEYVCKLWVGKDGNLKVRAYLGIFYRTITWLRNKNIESGLSFFP